MRDQRLTKLSYTTKLTPVIVQKDIDSFAKAREAGSRALFSAYVLERTCMVSRQNLHLMPNAVSRSRAALQTAGQLFEEETL